MHVGFNCFAARWRLAALLLLGCLSLAAHADEGQKPWESQSPPYLLEDRFRLQVSAWNAAIDTVARVDATTNVAGINVTTAGTTLSAEKELNLKRKQITPDFELTLFPGKNHLLRLDSFSSRRTGNTTLKNSVAFGKDVFNNGDNVDSTIELNMVGLGYGYRIFNARRYELTGLLRVQVATFSTNMQCVVCAARTTAPLPNYNRKPDTITLPLPMAGAEGRLQLYKKLDLTTRYQWLGATVVDTKGVIRDWQVGLLYHFRRNFGVGLDYRAYSIHVESNSTDHPGIFDMRYKGLQLNFRASL